MGNKNNRSNWYGWLPLLPFLLIIWAAMEAKENGVKTHKVGDAWKVIRVILLGAALVGAGFYFGRL